MSWVSSINRIISEFTIENFIKFIEGFLSCKRISFLSRGLVNFLVIFFIGMMIIPYYPINAQTIPHTAEIDNSSISTTTKTLSSSTGNLQPIDKSQLTIPQKKLGSDLLQLINANYLPQGQTLSSKKEQMQSLKQLIPASGVMNQALKGNVTGDMIYVYISYNANATTQSIESLAWNVTNRDNKNHLLVAWVDVNNLEKIASLDEVCNIQTVKPPVANMGSVTTEGDAILRTLNVRSSYGYTGSGVKIGIISTGVDHIAQSQASGNLPANVHVLRNAYGGDEGTAMLEIVYDMAPGAELYFHDCGNNWIDFNNAIDDLVANGCTVICDDIGWYSSPYFEDGIVASHINNLVNNNNIIYITSADNWAQGHYQGTYYRDGSTYWTDFSHGTSPYKEIYYYVPPGGKLNICLEWNDKFGASSNDYDLYLWDDYGNRLAYSINSQTGSQDPFEWVIWQNPYSYSVEVYASVYNSNMNAQTKTLELMTIEGGNYAESYNTNPSDSIFGQAAVSNVISVGAIDAHDNGNNDIEPFSSQGPATIYYPSPQVRSKPDISGIDGVSVTGAGGFYNPFYGTSAAAPAIAAVVAQDWSAHPGKTSAQIRSMVLSSAVDLGALGQDGVFGYGRADALNLYNAWPGTLQFGMPSYNVYENCTNAIVTVTRTNGCSGSASISYSTGGGNATPGVDYVTTSGILSFGNGEVSKNIIVPIVNKTAYSDDRSFYVSLSGPVNCDLGSPSSTCVTIMNDVAPPKLQFSASSYMVNENAGTVTITVSKAGTTNIKSSVSYATSNGNATAGTNYQATNGVLTFLPGDTTKTFTVPIIDDGKYDIQKYFNINLANPANASIGMSTSMVYINNIDSAPTMQFNLSSYSFNETDGSIVITITKTGQTNLDSSVSYTTTTGSATPGVNYNSVSSTLKFAPGEISKTFTVPLLSDSIYNIRKYFFVNLSSPINSTLGSQNVAIVYVNNSDPAPMLQFSASGYTVNENAGTVTVTVNKAGTTNVSSSVSYATSNGNATAGTNYQATSGVLTFLPGDTTKTFTVPIIDDGKYDIQRYFKVSLTNPTDASIGASTANVYINNIDSAPTVQFNLSSYTFNDSVGIATITVTKTDVTNLNSRVSYSTSPGNATPGINYNSANGVLNFAPGETSKIFDVILLYDANSSQRYFFVNLTSPVNSTLGSRDTAIVCVNHREADPEAQFYPIDYYVNENDGTATVNILRTGPTNTTATINFTTIDGSATAGTNYQNTSGVITFQPGDVWQKISVNIIDDGKYSDQQYFIIKLYDPQNVTLRTSVSTVYINNTESLPTESVYTLTLKQGWNIFSLPITPNDNQISSIFSPEQQSNIDVIWDFNNGDWKYWTTEPGYTNQFTTLSPLRGYYIYCYSPMTIQITGTPGSGPIPMDQLNQGWNIVGFPSTTNADISGLYGSADVVWKLDDGNWYYWTTEPGYTNQFNTLSPGLGYWVYKY